MLPRCNRQEANMTKLITRKTASPKRTDAKSPLIKLTETQLTVLCGAAQRPDGGATLPDGIEGKAACKLAATLAEKGFVREVRAKPGMPVWRKSEEEGSRSLIITKLGRATIGIDGRDKANAVDDLAINSPKKQTALAGLGSKAATPRHGSKLAEVIVLLTRKGGASIEELTSATGWLAHTTRATLTGLRKRGYGIERQRTGKGEASIYRIVNSPAHSLAA
jgi:Protein of unknown function (DUF3489)